MKDDGCRISPSCLKCPLPECIYVEPPTGVTDATLAKRNAVLSLKRQGMRPSDIARELGMGVRMVYRHLAASD